MDDQKEPVILQTKDLMKYLNLGRDRAYALMRTKGFPSIQLGKTFVVSKASLAKWLSQNEGRKIVI